MSKFEKCSYSLEDLENLRDTDGFIDLTSLNIKFTNESREIIGTVERLKNWVDFNGTKALIRGENTKNELTYGMYAELIVEEIARQKGIENAHYDLIKISDENGNITYGVLSVSMINNFEEEELITLYDMIGDATVEEREEYGELLTEEEKQKLSTIDFGVNDAEEFINSTSFYEDITKYDFTIERLREVLKADKYYTEEQIEKIILDYKKRLAFAITVLDGDKHLENISFIKIVKNGEHSIRIAPNYDSEKSLLLDTPTSYVKTFLEDSEYCKEIVDEVETKIGVIDVENGWGSFWRDTLEKLYEDDDEMFDYVNENLISVLDMNAVFTNIEKRIRAKIPEDVKTLSKYAYECRNSEIVRVLEGGIEQAYGFSIEDMLNLVILRGANQEQIRTGEQINIGNKMQAAITKDIIQEVENPNFEQEH